MAVMSSCMGVQEPQKVRRLFDYSPVVIVDAFTEPRHSISHQEIGKQRSSL